MKSRQFRTYSLVHSDFSLFSLHSLLESMMVSMSSSCSKKNCVRGDIKFRLTFVWINVHLLNNCFQSKKEKQRQSKSSGTYVWTHAHKSTQMCIFCLSGRRSDNIYSQMHTAKKPQTQEPTQMHIQHVCSCNLSTALCNATLSVGV